MNNLVILVPDRVGYGLTPPPPPLVSRMCVGVQSRPVLGPKPLTEPILPLYL